jgi:Spy/CpxP family protein refolding chaperone
MTMSTRTRCLVAALVLLLAALLGTAVTTATGYHWDHTRGYARAPGGWAYGIMVTVWDGPVGEGRLVADILLPLRIADPTTD